MNKLMKKLRLWLIIIFVIFNFWQYDISANNECKMMISDMIIEKDSWPGSSSEIRLSPVFLQLNGVFSSTIPHYTASNKSVYVYQWGRKVSLCLPNGIKRLYVIPEIIVNYSSGAIVWVCINHNLQHSSSSYNISTYYHDGVYNPTTSFIDSLTIKARTLEGSSSIIGYTESLKKWCKTEHSFYAFKNNKLVNEGNKWRNNRIQKYEHPLSCLTASQKGKKSILSVRDGVFVLAYNIPERDYPIFDACIRNTFVIKNRLMEFIDMPDSIGVCYKGADVIWRNLSKKLYLYYRLYDELSTITPPDSAEYKRLIFGDITTEPDTFLRILRYTDPWLRKGYFEE